MADILIVEKYKKIFCRSQEKDGGYLVLTDKTHVPVSQRKRQGLLDLFEQM